MLTRFAFDTNFLTLLLFPVLRPKISADPPVGSVLDHPYMLHLV